MAAVSGTTPKLFIQLPQEKETPMDLLDDRVKTISPRCQYLQTAENDFEAHRILGEGATGIVIEVTSPRGTFSAMKIQRPSERNAELSQNEWRILHTLELKRVRHVLTGKYDGYLTHLYCTDEQGNLHIDPSEEKIRRRSYAFVTSLLPCPNAYEMFVKSQDVTELLSEEIIHIGKQGYETLADLQEAKIAHLDIKPENIACDEKRNLTIFDWGSAQFIPINPRQSMGTLNYLAPEQILGSEYGANVDIWALGLTLFELYTADPLIMIETLRNGRQTTIDYLYILTLNLGPLPNGILTKRVSVAQKALLNYMNAIGGKYPGTLLWKARIYYAADQKGEDIEKADALIAFLEPMLSYENRTIPKEFFKEKF